MLTQMNQLIDFFKGNTTNSTNKINAKRSSDLLEIVHTDFLVHFQQEQYVEILILYSLLLIFQDTLVFIKHTKGCNNIGKMRCIKVRLN